MKKRESGYSLIEVLIAIAITSVVLLTVVTLFYMGRRNVYGGKQTTAAVAIGTRMLEDLSAMTASDILSAFNIDDNTAKTTVILDNVYGAAGGKLSFDNSVGRDTSACTVATTSPYAITCTNDTGTYLANWMKLVTTNADKNAVLASPKIGLVFTPRTPTDVSKPWTTATFMKVRVYIAYDEGGKRKYAFFDTTKVNR